MHVIIQPSQLLAYRYRRDFTSFNCIDNMWICINKVSRFCKGLSGNIILPARRSFGVLKIKCFVQKLATKQ